MIDRSIVDDVRLVRAAENRCQIGPKQPYEGLKSG